MELCMKWIENDRVIFIKNEHKNIKVFIPTFVKFYGPNNSDKKRRFSRELFPWKYFFFSFFFFYRYTKLFVYSKTSKHYFPLTIKSTIAKWWYLIIAKWKFIIVNFLMKLRTKLLSWLYFAGCNKLYVTLQLVLAHDILTVKLYRQIIID